MMNRRRYITLMGAMGLTGIAGISWYRNGPGNKPNNGGGGDGSRDERSSEGGGGSGVDSGGRSSGSWPMFQHDAANTGFGPETSGPRTGGNVSWTFETESLRDRFHRLPYMSPVVEEDTVYVGSKDKFLYALNASDGTELWRFETPDELFGTPAVARDTVFVGAVDGVYAIDKDNGTQKWKAPTEYPVFTSIAVSDEAIYFPSGGGIQAVNHSDGSPLWSKEARLTGDLAVQDGIVFFPVNERDDAEGWLQKVIAVEAETGSRLWEYTKTSRPVVREPWGSAPAVRNGIVYLGHFMGIHGVNAKDGERQFAFEYEDTSRDLAARNLSPLSPVITDEMVLWSVRSAGTKSIIGLSTESLRNSKAMTYDQLIDDAGWDHSIEESIGFGIYSAPVSDSRTVYFGAYTQESGDHYAGLVHALNLKDGQLLWTTSFGEGEAQMTPAVANGTIFVITQTEGTQKGSWKLYALAE